VATGLAAAEATEVEAGSADLEEEVPVAEARAATSEKIEGTGIRERDDTAVRRKLRKDEGL
jgi:hypothetical protein